LRSLHGLGRGLDAGGHAVHIGFGGPHAGAEHDLDPHQRRGELHHAEVG
jgi:hypothetical protein